MSSRRYCSDQKWHLVLARRLSPVLALVFAVTCTGDRGSDSDRDQASAAIDSGRAVEVATELVRLEVDSIFDLSARCFTRLRGGVLFTFEEKPRPGLIKPGYELMVADMPIPPIVGVTDAGQVRLFPLRPPTRGDTAIGKGAPGSSARQDSLYFVSAAAQAFRIHREAEDNSPIVHCFVGTWFGAWITLLPSDVFPSSAGIGGVLMGVEFNGEAGVIAEF